MGGGQTGFSVTGWVANRNIRTFLSVKACLRSSLFSQTLTNMTTVLLAALIWISWRNLVILSRITYSSVCIIRSLNRTISCAFRILPCLLCCTTSTSYSTKLRNFLRISWAIANTQRRLLELYHRRTVMCAMSNVKASFLQSTHFDIEKWSQVKTTVILQLSEIKSGYSTMKRMESCLQAPSGC